jgi:hypothetical protein
MGDGDRLFYDRQEPTTVSVGISGLRIIQYLGIAINQRHFFNREIYFNEVVDRTNFMVEFIDNFDRSNGPVDEFNRFVHR